MLDLLSENPYEFITKTQTDDFTKDNKPPKAVPESKSKFAKNFKDTHREKAPSYKTPALTKSTNMYIWVIATSN